MKRRKKKSVVYFAMSGDLIHHGHRIILKKASKLHAGQAKVLTKVIKKK